jgi:hypothetical protein
LSGSFHTAKSEIRVLFRALHYRQYFFEFNTVSTKNAARLKSPVPRAMRESSRLITAGNYLPAGVVAPVPVAPVPVPLVPVPLVPVPVVPVPLVPVPLVPVPAVPVPPGVEFPGAVEVEVPEPV